VPVLVAGIRANLAVESVSARDGRRNGYWRSAAR